ncbi:hypothetical protein Y032_0096g2938 [Ancylostoma ceylanicum]|uniref:Uncharacterized protein n=1 Tax=Ancylostoma ceylanicum TaxID=53326 RepID=A0A016TK73_9BILA|nr:hypothetical protein Y032_0096g2938 [Ancylostoma ceylanicum]
MPLRLTNRLAVNIFPWIPNPPSFSCQIFGIAEFLKKKFRSVKDQLTLRYTPSDCAQLEVICQIRYLSCNTAYIEKTDTTRGRKRNGFYLEYTIQAL